MVIDQIGISETGIPENNSRFLIYIILILKKVPSPPLCELLKSVTFETLMINLSQYSPPGLICFKF